MAVVRSFHKYRGLSGLSIVKIIPILEEQVPLVAPEQHRYRVTEIPSARTIRFYTARGLVDKPTEHHGTQAVYSYRHLLQILAIKYLQSQYLPLVKVGLLLKGASNRDLEQLIPEISPAVHRGITHRATPEPSPPPLRDGPGALPSSLAADADTDADTWHRVEVSPGIELHLHTAALNAEGRGRLRSALLQELGRMRGWFGEEKIP